MKGAGPTYGDKISVTFLSFLGHYLPELEFSHLLMEKMIPSKVPLSVASSKADTTVKTVGTRNQEAFWERMQGNKAKSKLP